MRILLVGGSGYVSRLMLPALLTQHRGRVLDLKPPAGDLDVEYVAGSAANQNPLRQVMLGVDAVVHSAMGRYGQDGWPDPAGAFEVNVASVYLTLLAAHEAGIARAVLISSMSVFANDPVPVIDRRLDEASPPDATDVYGLSKRLAEQNGETAVEAWAMTVTALRLGFPTTDAAWPRWALPAFPEPEQIRRADGSPLPALTATDLARAVLVALERCGGGFEVFHIHGDAASAGWGIDKARDHLGWLPRGR